VGAANAIDERYENLTNAQIAQLKAAYAQSAAEYQRQLDSAPAQYQSLRNEAYVNHALTERARQESIANMGLSGSGGTSQTIAQRNTGSLLGTLGDVSRQQQDFTDNINTALAGLGAQYGADVAGVTAKNQAQRIAALLEQERWEAQQAQAQTNSVFNQAYKLFRKRLITAAQFTAMTGISLKKR